MRDFGRPIQQIIIHCTATSQQATVDAISRFFYTPKVNAVTGERSPYIPNVQGGAGFKSAEGYHYIIGVNGERHIRHHLSEVTNGVRGYNWNSVHIAFIGGRGGVDDRTPAQKREMKKLIQELRSDAILGPIPVYGHRDMSPDRDGNGIITPDEFIKKCPSFSVSDWLKEIGLEQYAY